MERMKHTGDYELDEINMLEQECADLEEENKRLEEENRKLKEECEENEYLVHDNARWMKRCEEKITEIKKLKAEKEILEHKVKFLEGIIELNKQLKEMGK